MYEKIHIFVQITLIHKIQIQMLKIFYRFIMINSVKINKEEVQCLLQSINFFSAVLIKNLTCCTVVEISFPKAFVFIFPEFEKVSFNIFWAPVRLFSQSSSFRRAPLKIKRIYYINTKKKDQMVFSHVSSFYHTGG